MDNIIDKLVDGKNNKINNSQKHYDYDYFHNYSNNIVGSKNIIKEFILDHYKSINQDMINGIDYYLDLDINNRNTKNITKTDKINYILICFYIHVYHNNLDKIYLNSKYKEKLYILNKSRPDVLEGIIEFEDKTIINCNIRQILELPNQEKYNNIINKLTNIYCPMPYLRLDFNSENRFIITETCEDLNPSEDAFMEVFKDVINQLKCINKHYYLEYIKPKDIGKSKLNFKRYYIYNFDSICEKKDNITCYNLYDGRERYSKITDKDQIRTVLNILCEIYSTGTEDYRTYIKSKPFDRINKDLTDYQGEEIYNYLLNKLLSNSYQ